MTTPPPYCDCTLDGHSVQLVPDSHLLHNGQRVELPQGQNLLFVRIRQDGQAFAGQGHRDNLCWEWNGQWVSHGITEGTHPVIYDADGKLVIVRETAGAPTGSQGWRYVGDDGQLVSCDATYADPARHIWEYTTRGDITVGQGGDEEGLQALVRGRRVLLARGVVRFIRFYRRDRQLAIACVVDHKEARFLRHITSDDLDALPTYTIPGPTLPPEPRPEPEPMPTTPDHSALVLKVDRQFPHLLRENSRESCGEFTERAVLELAKHDANWGHVGKRPGQTQYRGHAVDAVMYKATAQVIDIIGGAESHAPTRPLWLEVPNGGQPWMAPIEPEGDQGDPGDETQPPPQKPEPPKACDCAAELKRLRERMDGIDEDFMALDGAYQALRQRVAELENKPAPKFVVRPASSLGMPTIGTSRVFGHAHEVRIVVVPE